MAAYSIDLRLRVLRDADAGFAVGRARREVLRQSRVGRSAEAASARNRRRIHGARGQRLLRLRGERLERPFAHLYETGGLRRVYLRGHANILKRVLIHAGGLNLGLLMRHLIGVGTPPQSPGPCSGLCEGPVVARSPPRDALEDDLDACSTDHPVGRPTSLTPQCLGRFVRRECFHHGLLGRVH